jgi:hypothetical protein
VNPFVVVPCKPYNVALSLSFCQVLSVIGEQYADDEVCGTVIAIRRNYFRIALWTKTGQRNATLESIG